ncbi:MAG: hypothetical protein FWE80_03130, partial [Oscillospiraceae bacterium]|nr:hypothetical protein [Oscillospiraceae bacterium]
MDTVICPACGLELKAAAVYCANCGHTLNDIQLTETAEPDAVEMSEEPAGETAAGVEAVTEPVSLAPFGAPEIPDATGDPDSVPLEPDRTEYMPVETAEPLDSAPARAVKATAAGKYSKLRIAFTVLLGILLFVCVCAAVCLHVVRLSVTEQAVRTVVADINVEILVDEYDIAGRIMKNLKPSIVSAYNISPYMIENLLERAFIKEYAAENFSRYIDAFSRGDCGYTLPKENLRRFLMKNKDEICRESGFSLKDEDIGQIVEHLEDTGFFGDISVEAVLGRANIRPTALQWPLSLLSLVISLMLCAVIVTGMFSLNAKRCRVAFMGTGVTLAAAGLLFIAVGLLFGSIFSMLTSVLNQKLVDILFSQMKAAALFAGLYVFAAGAGCVVIYALIRIFTKPVK